MMTYSISKIVKGGVKMRKAVVVLTAFLIPAGAMAGVYEKTCAGCHNGSLAPSKEQMKAKFKSAEEMFKAAEKSSNPMMAGIKTNKELLKKACKEVYGKNEK